MLEVFKDPLAGDQARQDDVAEGGVFAQQAPEVLCVHFVDLRDPEGHGACTGRVAGKVGHVAGEFTGLLMNGQRPQIAGGGTVNERDPARLKDIKAKLAFADRKKRFTRSVAPRSCVRAQRLHLGVVKSRESDGVLAWVTSGADNRWSPVKAGGR